MADFINGRLADGHWAFTITRPNKGTTPLLPGTVYVKDGNYLGIIQSTHQEQTVTQWMPYESVPVCVEGVIAAKVSGDVLVGQRVYCNPATQELGAKGGSFTVAMKGIYLASTSANSVVPILLYGGPV